MYDDEDHRRLMQLTLVFEYIEQDLFQFLQHYPQPNLPTNEIKVSFITALNHNF